MEFIFQMSRPIFLFNRILLFFDKNSYYTTVAWNLYFTYLYRLFCLKQLLTIISYFSIDHVLVFIIELFYNSEKNCDKTAQDRQRNLKLKIIRKPQSIGGFH